MWLTVCVCVSVSVLLTLLYVDESAAVCSNFQSSWSVLTSNEKVLLLGLIQSCFESAMFIFVFMWTPAMEATLPPNAKVCVCVCAVAAAAAVAALHKLVRPSTCYLSVARTSR